MDLGAPMAVTMLEPSGAVRVFSSDEQDVGELTHVLYDEPTDVFDGVVIDIATGPGGHRFVDAPAVVDAGASGIQIDIAAADVDGLPKPAPSASEIPYEPDDDSELTRKLKRAWDYVSGNY